MPLLTRHATFLAIDEAGRLTHRAQDGLQPGDTLLDPGEAGVEPRTRFLAFVENLPGTVNHLAAGDALRACLVAFAPDLRTLSIRRGRSHLCVPAPHDAPEFWSVEPESADAFVHVSHDELADLRFLIAHEWVVRPTRQILRRGDIRLGNDFTLQVGDRTTALAGTLPLLAERGAASDHPKSPRLRQVTVLMDGWKLLPLVLYRPLVFSVAFHDPEIYRQLGMCLTSLVDHGRHDGQIHLITDRSRPQIDDLIAPLTSERISLQHAHPTDRMGCTAAKFLIGEHADAHGFQPILFVDADTIFDRDVTGLLVAILLADRVCVPAEEFSPLRSATSMGADLLAADHTEVGEAVGGNVGTMGLQSLTANATFLAAMRAVMPGIAAAFGRDGHQWSDQPVSNYIGFKLGLIDTGSIGDFVDFGEATRPVGRPRRGLVHFWPAGRGPERTAAMARYLTELGGAEPAPALAVDAPARFSPRLRRVQSEAHERVAELPGRYYTDTLQQLHDERRVTRYLEIGVADGETLRLARDRAVAIDPAARLSADFLAGHAGIRLFDMTSDDYFANHDPRDILGGPIELAFIDGMHRCENVLRDFINVERHCSPDAVIAIHDVVPLNHEMSERTHRHAERTDKAYQWYWTGDVWRLLPVLRALRPDLHIEILDCPSTGLAVITNLNPGSRVLADSQADLCQTLAESQPSAEQFWQFIGQMTLTDSRSYRPPV